MFASILSLAAVGWLIGSAFDELTSRAAIPGRSLRSERAGLTENATSQPGANVVIMERIHTCPSGRTTSGGELRDR